MELLLEKSNRLLRLEESQKLAGGGEAIIYTHPDLPGSVAKVYHQVEKLYGPKIAAMLERPPRDPTRETLNHTSIAWPTDRLWLPGKSRECAGYVMPRIDEAHLIFKFFNPRSRLSLCPLFHYGYLLRTARNLTNAVRALHDLGYVIGDLNESNILVNNRALVSLVDTDSFQVPCKGRTFRCPVGKAEYTPPELQNVSFAEVDRTPQHDAFALAVLLFQLLMQGQHPFAGRSCDDSEPTELPARISAGHWPYARNKATPYLPPPHAPPWESVPDPIRELFHRCFEDGHSKPDLRPNMVAWADALTRAEEGLQPCRNNGQHLYPITLDACPWCVQSRRSKFDPFPSTPEPQRTPNEASPSPPTQLRIQQLLPSDSARRDQPTSTSSSTTGSALPPRRSLGFGRALGMIFDHALVWAIVSAGVLGLTAELVETFAPGDGFWAVVHLVARHSLIWSGVGLVSGLLLGISRGWKRAAVMHTRPFSWRFRCVLLLVFLLSCSLLVWANSTAWPTEWWTILAK